MQISHGSLGACGTYSYIGISIKLATTVKGSLLTTTILESNVSTVFFALLTSFAEGQRPIATLGGARTYVRGIFVAIGRAGVLLTLVWQNGTRMAVRWSCKENPSFLTLLHGL